MSDSKEKKCVKCFAKKNITKYTITDDICIPKKTRYPISRGHSFDVIKKGTSAWVCDQCAFGYMQSYIEPIVNTMARRAVLWMIVSITMVLLAYKLFS